MEYLLILNTFRIPRSSLDIQDGIYGGAPRVPSFQATKASGPTACVPPLGGTGLNPHRSVRITLVIRPTACVPPLGGIGLNPHRSVRITNVILSRQPGFYESTLLTSG